jgi:hypothetical protein
MQEVKQGIVASKHKEKNTSGHLECLGQHLLVDASQFKPKTIFNLVFSLQAQFRPPTLDWQMCIVATKAKHSGNVWSSSTFR